jgi:hypothetical protein
MRPWHYLEPLKSTRRPGQVIALEAANAYDEDGRRVSIISAVKHRRDSRRHTSEKTYSWRSYDPSVWNEIGSLAQARRGTWLITLDLQSACSISHLWDYLDARRAKVRRSITTRQATILEIQFKAGIVHLLSLNNWFRENQEAIESVIGAGLAPKPASTLPAEVNAWTAQRAMQYIVAYEAYERWLTDNRLGTVAKTIASQSMVAYRTTHQPGPILIHGDEELIALERASYFGEEVLCNRIGKYNDGPYYAVDANSLYPSVMAKGNYPVSLMHHWRGPSVEAIAEYMPAYCIAARVTVESGFYAFPARLHDRTVFGTGRFTTTLCDTELSQAVKDRMICKVHECAIYRTADLFSEWANDTYAMRLRYRKLGDYGYEFLSKLSLVSLHGKFGQMRGRWIDTDKGSALYRWGTWSQDGPKGECSVLRAIAGHVQTYQQGEEGHDSLPAIPAVVTTRARQFMATIRHIAGPRHWYYQGTDCLIVDRSGMRRLKRAGLIAETGLGLLKVDDVANEIQIVGRQCYRFGTQWVMSGVSEVATLPDGRIVQRYRESLERQLMDGLPGDPRSYERVLEWPAVSPGGIVGVDGWVTPYQLCDGSKGPRLVNQ